MTSTYADDVKRTEAEAYSAGYRQPRSDPEGDEQDVETDKGKEVFSYNDGQKGRKDILCLSKELITAPSHTEEIGRHSAEHGVGPQCFLACLITILGHFGNGTLSLKYVMLVERLSFENEWMIENYGNDEENGNCHQVWQHLFFETDLSHAIMFLFRQK
jgi:hypothetical protein